MTDRNKPPAPPPQPAAAAPAGKDQPETDQEMLDESLAETFPASDPIAPGSAERAQRLEDERDAAQKKAAEEWAAKKDSR